MGLFNKILGKKANYKQSDNKGTYHNNEKTASFYWTKRNALHKFDPFLLYKFSDESDAVRSLLGLECIKIAEDTEEIICTEDLIYGYYALDTGEYEVILCGEALSSDLFISAKKIFEENNGTKINEKQPGAKLQAVNKSKEEHTQKKTEEVNTPEPQNNEVEYVKIDKQVKDGTELLLKHYKSISAASAVSFLEKNTIPKDIHSIVVETPQGSFGKDKQGIYKVRT